MLNFRYTERRELSNSELDKWLFGSFHNFAAEKFILRKADRMYCLQTDLRVYTQAITNHWCWAIPCYPQKVDVNRIIGLTAPQVTGRIANMLVVLFPPLDTRAPEYVQEIIQCYTPAMAYIAFFNLFRLSPCVEWHNELFRLRLLRPILMEHPQFKDLPGLLDLQFENQDLKPGHETRTRNLAP